MTTANPPDPLVVINDPPTPLPLPPSSPPWETWDVALRVRSMEQDKALREASTAAVNRQAAAMEASQKTMAAFITTPPPASPIVDFEYGFSLVCAMLKGGHNPLTVVQDAKLLLPTIKAAFPRSTPAPK